MENSSARQTRNIHSIPLLPLPHVLTLTVSLPHLFAHYHPPKLNQDLTVGAVNKQPQTFGELLTLGTIVASTTHFTAPVDMILGENDLVFCGGDCTKPQDQSAMVAPVFYSAAKTSQH